MRASVLLRCNPAGWRWRYGDEMADLLGRQPFTLPLALDLVRGAVDAHLHPELVRVAWTCAWRRRPR